MPFCASLTVRGRIHNMYSQMQAPFSPRPGEKKMVVTMTPEMPRKKRMKSDFGERLIELRKARSLTQYDMADLIGTTQRTISYYENEGGHSQAPVMAHLARALNISTDELLGVKKGVRTSQAKKTAANHEDPGDSRRLEKVSATAHTAGEGPARRHSSRQLSRRFTL